MEGRVKQQSTKQVLGVCVVSRFIAYYAKITNAAITNSHIYK